jgi:hypothetical protein
MPAVLPSHIITAIDTMFGPQRNELDVRAVRVNYKTEVYALLALLDAVPTALIDLNAQDYLEYTRCRGVLATTLALWNVGGVQPAPQVNSRDVIERVRQLMAKCHDELPPSEPELPFIADDDVRLGIEDRIRAAWTDFNAREWMGATVLAGHVVEALLLWAINHKGGSQNLKKTATQLHLHDLIEEAAQRKFITPQAKLAADLAKDARNLIHPGRASRSGTETSKATALAALAAVYRIADDLRVSMT